MDRQIRQENQITVTQTGMEEVKLSLLSDNMILHRQNPKDPQKKNEFLKEAGYKINLQK